MGYALGIDFGGTKILGSVVDTETGKVLAASKKRTRSEHGSDNIMKRLLDVASDAIGKSGIDTRDIQAIGIGAAGQIDPSSGALVRAPNLPNELLGTTIITSVQSQFKLPVKLFNDVAAAAAGEAAFGAGQGYPDFVCMFVGTGIGGAVYQGGRPYAGATNTAGELGHMVVDIGGRLCGCGGKGHLEAYASRTAMVRSMLAAMRQGRSTVLQSMVSEPNPDDVAHSPVRSRIIAEAIAAKDSLVIDMIEDGARYMAAGLTSIINFYNPPRIILGGGVVDAVDLYFERAVAGAKQEALLVPREHVDIVKTRLGDYSGVVGSAILAGK